MSLIKNLDALEQPLDFLPFKTYSKTMSDLDCGLWLCNDKYLLIEVKKDTFKHSKKNIINSAQWKFLREIAGYRPDVYLIYATHTQEIDIKNPIMACNCTVQYIEYLGKELEYNINMNLLNVVKYFTNKKDFSKYNCYRFIKT